MGARERADDACLAEIARRLVQADSPEGIDLFGSNARDDDGPDGDDDPLVLVADDSPPEPRRSRSAYEVLRGRATAADLLLRTRREYENRLRLPPSLAETAEGEGVLFHAA